MTPHNGRHPHGTLKAIAGLVLLICAATIATWMISTTWSGSADRPRVVVEAR